LTGRRVSVALATFNGERFLAQQLESLAAQTLAPYELVVCDDRSTDATAAILSDFARSSPFPVHVRVNEARLGFADNFLTAASRCGAELIAFCDQDDVWHETKLERCAEAFAPGVVLAVHNCVVTDEDLRPTGQIFPGVRRRATAPPLTSDKWFHMPGMAMVFAAELVRLADWRRRPPSHLVPGSMVFHDEWIHVLAQVYGSIAFLPDRLALYRQHPENVTGAPARLPGGLPSGSLTTGLVYYAKRSEQARDWSSLFARLARAETDPARRLRAERGLAFFEHLADGLELRASLYARRGRIRRSVALGRALVGGGYGRRRLGGSGLRALARDALMIALGRGG
jgi:glycosyltransferase involved in cell wall biosynthesis